MIDVTKVALTHVEIENILAAYRQLKDRNPFFNFNAETQVIIDKLTIARATLNQRAAEGMKAAAHG